MGKPTRPSRVKIAEQAGREARLAKALRDNLRRRKEQARAQATAARTGQSAGQSAAPRREDEPAA